MSERTIRGRGGRKSKGPRRSRTLRVPYELDDDIEAAFAASGHRDVNAFLVDVLIQAKAAGLFPEAHTAQGRLEISA
jgi:hypothetical protein